MQLLAAVEVGQYVSIWKIIVLLVILLIWAKLLTWMDKDSIDAHLPQMPLNSGLMLGFILGIISFLMLPTFLVALSVLLFFMAVDVGLYLLLRQRQVGLSDLSTKFKDWLHGLFHREKVATVAEGAVQLITKSGQALGAPDSEDPDLPAFEATQKLLTDPMRRHAEVIELTPQEGAAAVRYTVDGMTYSGQSMSREEAAACVNYLKGIAGMDTGDKRKPQSGKMKVSFGGKRHEYSVRSAGSTAGESLTIKIDPKERHNLTVDELGFDENQLNTITDLIKEGGGIVLLSTPKSQGLKSLLYGVLRKHDAFLSHLQTIERHPPVELEGITQNTLPSSAPPAEEVKLTEWVTSQEPDVIAMPRVDDARSAMALIKFAESAEHRRVYVGLRASSTMDALSQWRKLVGDDKLAMKHLRLIVNGRLVRKLCMACKVGYTPEPEVLRRLNMAPEKVGKLFQARTQPLRDPKGNPLVCEFCTDLRFVGRTGVYEMFIVDDEVRQVIAAGGSINQLKALFRKQRRKYLQEEALARVEAGETSVQEVLRVLKIGDSSPPSASSSASRKVPT
jgi:type II secretory ATPase GspE/PulE/Tfp pilus assembly ATPase PilB-like protein